MSEKLNEILEDEYGRLLLQFIGSLTLADHLGDVCNDIDTLLYRLNINLGDWNDLEELGDICGELGITTLYGTELSEP